jgi:hypothetical protein
MAKKRKKTVVVELKPKKGYTLCSVCGEYKPNSCFPTHRDRGVRDKDTSCSSCHNVTRARNDTKKARKEARELRAKVKELEARGAGGPKTIFHVPPEVFARLMEEKIKEDLGFLRKALVGLSNDAQAAVEDLGDILAQLGLVEGPVEDKVGGNISPTTFSRIPPP